MNTKNLLVIIYVQSSSANANGPLSYIIGSIIALLILCYLIYTLLKPEKF